VSTPKRKKVCPRATGTVSCLLAALVLALASPALGADSATEQARQHYEIGTQQYDLGHWDDAIREFEKAYELRPDPSFLYNLAQAYRRKGDARRALDLYKNYLAKVPKAPQRPEIEGRINSLQKQIEEAAPAQPARPALEPTVTSPELPTSPADVPAPTEASATSSPQVSPEPAALPATSPVAPPARRSSQAPPAATGTTSGPTPFVADAAAIQPAPRGRGLRIAGLTCGGLGVVAVGLGLLEGVMAYYASRKVATEAQFNPSEDTAGKRFQDAELGYYVVGAGLLATGAVLYYFGARAARTTPSGLSLSPVLGPGTAGLSAVGVF
jgi:tetratricopeptide (TPR) repeat protein